MNDFIASLLLMGAFSTGTYLPFWAVSNQYGLYPVSNGALMVASVNRNYNPEKTFDYTAGASLALCGDSFAGSSAVTPMIDELYAGLRWKAIGLELGIKHPELDYFGASRSLGSLSSTGGHLCWSGNSRGLPGARLFLDQVAVPWTKEHLFIQGEWADYTTTDKRHVQGTLVHRMKANVIARFTDRFSMTLGIDHYALWGGVGPDGLHPVNVTFANYFRVVTGSSAGNDGMATDQANCIGDHGGTELIRFDYRGNGWKAAFQHEIPYSDKSGMTFHNFPDGVNTLAFSFDDKDRWISDVVYEFIYTMYQSGPIHDPEFNEEGKFDTNSDGYYFGLDDYFNNGVYQSGWTHYGRPCTIPLFYPQGTRDGKWGLSPITRGIENNRIIANHIGISGKLFHRSPYRLMLTHSLNYGIYPHPYAGESACQKPWGSVKETPLSQFSTGLNGEYHLGKGALAICYGLYFDAGQVLGTNFGATLGLRYILH